MKVKDSPYISRNRALFQKLLRTLLEEYPYASVLAADSREKTYSVNRRLTSIRGGGMMSARGFVARVFDGSRWSEHSFNEISEELLPAIAAQIRETAAMSERILPDGIRENVYAAPDDAQNTFRGSTEYEIDPEQTGDDAVLARLREIRDRGLAYSDRLLEPHLQAVPLPG